MEKESYAIVGASNNPQKYGYKIMLSLKELGYKVFPVNPREDTILGKRVFRNIGEINEKVDWVVFVIPPEASEKVLLELKEKGLKKAWFQPGSESQKAIDFCKENGILCIYGKCIMVEKGNIK